MPSSHLHTEAAQYSAPEAVPVPVVSVTGSEWAREPWTSAVPVVSTPVPMTRTSVTSPRSIASPAAAWVAPSISQPAPSSDVCSISPALRSWIECLVDNRMDQVSRALHEGELATVVDQVRKESGALSSNATFALQQSEEARLRLEAQVRGLADGQSRLLAIVEGMTGDTERQSTTSNKAKAEALATVERVVATVDELRNTVEQDSDATNARLREHSLAIEEIRRSMADELARVRASATELQRHTSETASRQRQCGDEVATTAASVAATRQELSDLVQMMQRLDRKLLGWREDIKAEVMEQMSHGVALREADKNKIDELSREFTQLAAGRIELETRLEGLRVEITSAGRMKTEHDSRLRDLQQSLTRRLEDAEERMEILRSELSSASSARVDQLDTRSKESQNALSRRIDALQAAATEDVETVKQDVANIAKLTHRLDERQSALREEISTEVRSAISSSATSRDSWRNESLAATDSLRREVIQQMTDMDSQMERLRIEQTTVAATRESFEFRVRENSEELKRCVESLQRDLSALSHRHSTESESLRSSMREELQSLTRKLGSELRADSRALFKQEQNAIAALDEQLWLTDQRLGQRIDEILQASVRHDRISAIQAVAEELFKTHQASASSRRGGRLTGVDVESMEASLGSRHTRNSALAKASASNADEETSARGTLGALGMAREAAEAFQSLASE
eukprot:TRINITY_DN9418_c0_g1_i2.p1 TRINITY_DN9418_c0_g1~~TRINITY_DN9418_c0_g1_i2.p1  ORF type:complete len:709 (-),score=162.40 TRINITY_DN9418_c0_g1_i2:29-2113(-)